jgi:spoIIIJ-associated protein
MAEKKKPVKKAKSKAKKATKPESKDKDKTKLVEKLSLELFKLLKLNPEVRVSQDQEGVIHLQIDGDDPGALIGYHGETLYSIQLILAMMIYRQTGEWTRVLVNVGDYRERRQESLEKMALSAAQKVRFSNEAQALPPMNSAERRLIHLALTEDPEVTTESDGEGDQRRVVVRPKSE